MDEESYDTYKTMNFSKPYTAVYLVLSDAHRLRYHISAKLEVKIY